MEQIGQNIRISSVEVCFDDSTLPKEREETLKEAFASVGKDLADFMVTDYRVKAQMLPQAQDMLAFFAGLIALLRLLARIWEFSVPRVMELNTKAILSPRMLRKHREKQMIGLGAALFAALASVAALLLLSTWEVAIPAQYMPAELIDVKFFYNLFIEGFRKSLNAAGYVPMWWEVATEAASRMISSLTLWGLFGLAIATPSLALAGRKAPDKGVRALQAVVTLIVMLLLTAGIAAILGVSITFSLRQTILLCLYCFASVALIKPKRPIVMHSGEIAEEVTEETATETKALSGGERPAEEFETTPAIFPEPVTGSGQDAPESTQKGNIDS